MILGPHTAGPAVHVPEFKVLAEFGVVFLLFSIGLNYSLPQLHAMRHQVFGLGTAQVALSTAVVATVLWLAGLDAAAAMRDETAGMTSETDTGHRRYRLAELLALLDQSREAILSRDMADRIRFWNKGAERLFGWRAEETLGCYAPDLLHPSPEDYAAARAALFAQGWWIGDLQKSTRSGQRLTIESAGC